MLEPAFRYSLNTCGLRPRKSPQRLSLGSVVIDELLPIPTDVFSPVERAMNDFFYRDNENNNLDFLEKRSARPGLCKTTTGSPGRRAKNKSVPICNT